MGTPFVNFQVIYNAVCRAASPLAAGPGVGATLQTLLNDVMEGTLPNEREALLAAAVK